MCVHIYSMCCMLWCIVCLCLVVVYVHLCTCGVYMARHTLTVALSSRLSWHVGQYHMLEACSNRRDGPCKLP